jgi:hypothetical protein
MPVNFNKLLKEYHAKRAAQGLPSNTVRVYPNGAKGNKTPVKSSGGRRRKTRRVRRTRRKTTRRAH